MNTFQINGALIGNGTVSPNRFAQFLVTARAVGGLVVIGSWRLIASVTCTATSTAAFTQQIFMQAAVTATAVGSELGTRFVRIASAITGRATGVLVAAQVAATALVASVTARAYTFVRAGMVAHVVSSGTAFATSLQAVFKIAPRLQGAVTATASGTIVEVFNSGQPAPDERQIIVPEETRYMEVME
jgi:hypothetical protein